VYRLSLRIEKCIPWKGVVYYEDPCRYFYVKSSEVDCAIRAVKQIFRLRSVTSVNGRVRSRDHLPPWTMSQVLVSQPPMPSLAMTHMMEVERPRSQQQLHFNPMNMTGDVGTASMEEKRTASQVRL
jgi:hypothetical protein